MNKRRYKIIAFEGIDGSGKTTALTKLYNDLAKQTSVMIDRLAPIMVEIYKELIDEPTGLTGEYQNVIPSDFRLASYIFESAIQMRIKDEEYSKYNFILFDRWLYTNIVYLSDINWHKQYFNMIMDRIPEPDITFYLYVDANTAIDRLRKKDDWMVLRYNSIQLQEKFNNLIGKFDLYFKRKKNVVFIDANRDINQVYSDVKKEILKLIENDGIIID